MTIETYATRIRREAVLASANQRTRLKLYHYLRRAMYGTRPGVPGHARYKAAAKAAFGE